MHFIGAHCLDGTVLTLGTCLVMAPSVLLGRPGKAWTAPLRWFGSHSYEVYLTHEFVVLPATALYARVQGPLGLWCPLVLLGTALLGAAVATWFSEPLNRALRGPDGAGGGARCAAALIGA